MTAQTVSPPSASIDAPMSGEVATPVANAAPVTRLFFADHLRVFLTALVVLHHLTITYGVMIGWYYQEVTTDPFVNSVSLLFILFNQAYFMGLFFFLAAYFTPASFDRKGAGTFVKDRLVRLGLPFLAYDLVIGPLASLGLYSTVQRGDTPYWRLYLTATGAGVAWFIEALLLFSVGYAAWRVVGARRGNATPIGARPLTARTIVGFTLILMLASFLARIVSPLGTWVPWFNLQLGYFPQYIAMFVAGLVAYRRGWLTTIPARFGAIGFAVAIVATVLLFPLALLSGEGMFIGGGHWQSAVYAIWDSLVCVGMALGLLTFFRARLNATGRGWRFLSAQAYTVYLIHPVILVTVGLALRGLVLYPLLKLALVALICLPLCFAAAALLRRIPPLARIL